jgi:drug/metabolite transporter (DMT)-like permease
MTVSRRLQPHVIGMILMACVGLVFATHDTVSKTLVATLPVVFVAWARYLSHTCLVGFILYAGKARALPRTRRPWLHVFRALCLTGDTLFFLYGLVHVPLAETTALIFLAPTFVTILSPMVFGTRMETTQWLSVIIGFIGVLAIINPQSDGFNLWYLSPLAAAFFFALYQILTQIAGETDAPSTSSFYVGAFATLLLSALVPFHWVDASMPEWTTLFALGGMGLCGHFLLSKSYRYASSAVLAPLGYLQIVFATLFGVLVFKTEPASSSMVGIALVLISGLLVYGRKRAAVTG